MTPTSEQIRQAAINIRQQNRNRSCTGAKMSLLDDYFSDPEFADEIGVTTRTTKSYRDQRVGPPVTYVRGKPYYRKEAVRHWLLAKEGKCRGAV